MKITLLTPALAAILGLALASAPTTLQAQTNSPATTTTAPAPAPKPAKPTEFRGTLTAVDTAASTITVATQKSTKDTEKTIAIASTTKVKKDGKPATLADFSVGDKVSGSYRTDDAGKMTAASLNSKAAKTEPAPVTTPASTPASTDKK